MEVFYIMAGCGCRVTPEGTKTIYAKTDINHTHTRHRVCIEHGTRVSHRVTACSDCGIEFQQHKSGHLSVRCPSCRTAQKREKRRLKAYHYRMSNNGLSDSSQEGNANDSCPLFQHVCKICIDQHFPCAVRQAKALEAAA